MKRLILIRHSKSSWKDLSLTDFNRPLNGRGKLDGPLMADYLKSKIDKIDYLHSSSSIRTFDTSKYFINKIQFGKVEYDDSLYHSSATSILNMISNYSENYQSVMIIAHNPGLTNLINNITNISLDNLPTTGLAEIEFNINSWRNISYENSNLLDLKYPKQLK
jgi:phosphohistidine phosphatase